MESDAIRRKRKQIGQVFTPPELVTLMLDFSGYRSGDILRRHVMDNSCGDGAFLSEIVRRYCQDYGRRSSDKDRLKCELETYIHGIEIETETHRQCLRRLDDIAAQFGMHNVNWDVIQANALHVRQYDGSMDFVVGNPPYVRVHNLQDNYDDVKQYTFADKGMTDLFIVFFEIGFRMMRPNGRMVLITPGSWLSSKAGLSLRNYLLASHKLKKVIDLGHFQAFEGVTTYTLISYFENQPEGEGLEFFSFDEQMGSPHFEARLLEKDYTISGHFYLGNLQQLNSLRKIKSGHYACAVKVKNGFATLADKVFIGNVPVSPITIDILKASTGTWKRGLFPYTQTGKPLTWPEIEQFPSVARYFLSHREELTKCNNASTWYLYGRTQALHDVYQPKVAVNVLVRDIGSLKLKYVAPGKGVYSGLYVLGISPQSIRTMLETDDFFNYIALLRNYKSGGYYTFSSKALEQFINYQINQQNGRHEERSIPAFCGTFF